MCTGYYTLVLLAYCGTSPSASLDRNARCCRDTPSRARLFLGFLQDLLRPDHESYFNFMVTSSDRKRVHNCKLNAPHLWSLSETGPTDFQFSRFQLLTNQDLDFRFYESYRITGRGHQSRKLCCADLQPGGINLDFGVSSKTSCADTTSRSENPTVPKP